MNMKKLSEILLCATFALCQIATAAEAPVNLRSAATFAVLAGSTVTSTGATQVTGDLGVSPGSAVTGFPPGTVVSGAIHVADLAAGQAMAALTTAYNDAAGRSVAPVTVAGNIGGQTLAPGLYKSTSSLAVSSGELTLDGQGNANAVWIFQIASTLTTTSGRQVILIGGAQASNIFWQVGTSATLGSSSVFKGTIMADQSITMNTGATLEGRALARIGGGTLQGNAITLPIPIIAPPPSTNPGGVVNGARYTTPVAPGSIASAFGSNLSFGQASASTTPLPITLAGSSFQIGGQSAPLFYASPSQVNLQIPWELAGQTQGSVTATVGAVASNQQAVNLAPFAPGIFTLSMTGTGQGAVRIPGTGQLVAPQSIPGSRPARPGEFIEIYCTGLGAVSNQPATGAAAQASPLSRTSTTPTVTIGGVFAQVDFSGLAPGAVGLYQVNVQVPGGAPVGDAVAVVISIGGATSNTVTIAVQ